MTGSDEQDEPRASGALVSAASDHWGELLTVALLGTDRRDPPEPVDGAVAHVVADTVRADPARRLLADVAATAVLRRAAFMAGRAADRLRPPPADPRPECPTVAVVSWRYLSAEWPVLLDEWLGAVLDHGWRLPADVVVSLLRSSRTDPDRRATVLRAAGPVATWLVDHVPTLAPGGAARLGAGAPPTPAVTSVGPALPELAIPPDLQPLLLAEPDAFLAVVIPEFEAGNVGAAHRAVWVNVVARCRSDVLGPLADALATIDSWSPSSGIAHVLADLARTRHRMLAELRR